MAKVRYRTLYSSSTGAITISKLVIDGSKTGVGSGVYQGARVRLDCMRFCSVHESWRAGSDYEINESAAFRGVTLRAGAQIRLTITQEGSFGFYDLLTAVRGRTRSFTSKKACLWYAGSSLEPLSCKSAWNHLVSNPYPGRYCGRLPRGGSICLHVTNTYWPKLTISAVANEVPCADGFTEDLSVNAIRGRFAGLKFTATDRLQNDAFGFPQQSSWTISGRIDRQQEVATGTVSMTMKDGFGTACALSPIDFTAKYRW